MFSSTRISFFRKCNLALLDNLSGLKYFTRLGEHADKFKVVICWLLLDFRLRQRNVILFPVNYFALSFQAFLQTVASICLEASEFAGIV